MTQLIFQSYQIDNINNDPFQGAQIDWELGTSTGVAGNGSVLDNINNINASPSSQFVNSSYFLADPYYFTQLGSSVLFFADDGVHGRELWITDGTQGGTKLVKDIDVGSASGININTNPAAQSQVTFNEPVVVGNEMYFEANDGAGPNELWKTNGTASGTVLVQSFNSDTTQSSPEYLVNFNSELYFVGNGKSGFVSESSASGPQIWKTDGTTTTQVTNIAPSGTPDPSDGPAGPFSLTVAGSNLFFVWYNGNDNDVTDKEQQLWVINSTNPTGLALTTQSIGGPGNLTNINGELYFAMNDGVHGQELWKSDGTVLGTQLVDDIAPGSGGNNAPGSAPFDMTAFNSEVYFIANDGTHGDQIWKSDGSSGGTQMVTNFASSSELFGPDMTVVGNTLFFAANDPSSGDELWELDTTGAYNIVKDINPGNSGSSPSELTNINGTLYFGVQSSGDGHGNELWMSDGTGPGTVEVTNLYNYRNGFSQISYIPTSAQSTLPVVVIETATVIAGATATGTATTSGTGALAGDSDPGSLALSISAVTGGSVGSPVAGTYGHLTLNADGSYSYIADMPVAIGTAATGSHITDTFTYTVSDTGSNSSSATIKFTVDRAPNATSHHILVDVGLASGTVSLGDTDPDGNTVTVTAVNGGTVGTALAGTYGTLTINANDTYTYTASNTAAINATPINVTPTDTFTYTVSDPTGATATETLNVAVNRPSTTLAQLIFQSYQIDNINNDPFQGAQIDWELGTSTGVAGNGSVLDNINNINASPSSQFVNSSYFLADPYYFTQLGSSVLFFADDGVHGRELWITDGTQGGTKLVKDIDVGSASGININTNPAAQSQVTFNEPVVVGNEMYFEANDGAGPNELWKTNGTASGTVLVQSFNSDTTQSSPEYLVNFNSELYFVGNGKSGFVSESSASGPQIWKTDGTTTTQVTNIAPSGTPDPSDGPAGPFSLTVAGSNLFFVWYNGNDNDVTDKEQQLWVINSTNPTGLALTTQSIGGPGNLTNINGELYFAMNDGVHGQELWKSDGTVLGTQLVDDIAPGSGGNNAPGSAPFDMTAFNSEVYFIANDGTHGDQIWKSDGSSGGTQMVTDFGSASSPSNLTAVGNTLFFTASVTSSGDELWEVDTSGNYNLVKDINPGTNGSSPSELTDIDGILYFGVESSGDANGTELWRSDGTAAGTYELTNVYNYRNGFSPISYIVTAPVVTAGATATFNGGGAAVKLDSALTVTDTVSTTLASATVSIGTGFVSGDILNFTNQNGITGTYNSGTGVLTLSGTSSVANYQVALASITYSFNPSNADPTNNGTEASRTIDWTVNDGTTLSLQATSTLDTVHVAPAIVAGVTVDFSIGGSPVAVDSGLTVSDPDSSGNLTGASVSIVSGLNNANDSLNSADDTLIFTNQNGITGSYAANTGILTLSGTATVAQYQTALESITFGTTTTNVGSRTIDWTVTDGNGSNGSSATVTSTVAVAHGPAVTAGAIATFTGGGSAVAADPGLTLTDGTSLTISSATVSISGGFLVGDLLNFTNQKGITGSYAANTGILSLSGTATIAQYQAALASITYSFSGNGDPTAGGHSNRTISWVANDGTFANTAATSTVNAVHGAPTVIATATPSFSEREAAVTLDAALTLADPDSGNMLTGATVTITAGAFAGDGDVLAANTTGTAITASYSGITETLTLNGSDTLADYQKVLASVTFITPNINPTNSGLNQTRTVTFAVNDGASSNNTASANISLSVKNSGLSAGTTDVMIMNRGSDGSYEIFDIGHNVILVGYSLGQISTSLQIAGLGDFSGNPGEADMLMRNGSTGAFELYDIGNNNITGSFSMGQVGTDWSVAGFADFSGNANETDMLMRQNSTGAFELYDIANDAYTGFHSLGQVGPEWTVSGFGDFSGNAGETDMLMRNSSTGAFELYDIVNNQYTGFYSLGQVGPEWTVAGFGDFSGNAGETDMLMRNSSTGAFELYDIANNQFTGFHALGQVGPEWQVAGFGDLSSNANETDMLMRNSNTGAFELYDISNNQFTGFHAVGQTGTEWTVAGIASDPPPAAPLAQGSDPAGSTALLVQAMTSFGASGAGGSPSGLVTTDPTQQTVLTTPQHA